MSLFAKKTLPLFFFFFFLAGCGQSFNSHSTDRFKGSGNIDISTPSGLRLFKAYEVIQNRCINCHTGYHNSWNQYNSDQDWLDQGLVIKGDFRGSQIISRLQNEGSDMPLFAAQIPEADYQLLKDWIENMP